MRQLWAALALLTALTAGLVLLGRQVDDLTAPMVADLTQASQAAEAGDWQQVRALTDRAAARWEEAGRWLRLAEAHEAIVEVAGRLDEGAIHARQEDGDAYQTASRQACRALEALSAAERLTLGNLF